MGPFKSYLDAAIEVWKSATPAARIGIALLATLCISAIIGVGYWSAQPSYVTLVSGVEEGKMDKVIDGLDKAGIEYTLSGAGGNLSVDKRDFAKARMIARGTGVAANETTGFPGGNAFGSPDERRNQARLQKQHSLADTIRKLNAIDLADVHLNIPDKGPFDRSRSKPSASVLLTLVPGSQLTNEQAISIASLVAFAVEDLEPEGVQITDKNGRSYTIPDNQVQQINSQVEYIEENERKLARKAETQLLHFLGHGNANVEVALDLTFTNGSKTVTNYDSEGKVPNEEDLVTETTTDKPSVARGPAVADAGLQSENRGSPSTVLSKTENIKTSYLVPKTEETSVNITPIRNFMTVSVVVNSAAAGVANEDGSIDPALAAQVRGIVENAVGFKTDTDTISVEFLPFPEDELAGIPADPPVNWVWVNELIRNASLAFAAIVALIVGVLLMRKIKPVATVANDEVRLASTRSDNLDQLSDLVKSNPEVFSLIVKNWAEGPGAGSKTVSNREAA